MDTRNPKTNIKKKQKITSNKSTEEIKWNYKKNPKKGKIQEKKDKKRQKW